MRIITPMPNSSYTITAAAEWPSIPFQTDATGQHTWNWALVWGRYKQSGSASTPSNQWDAKSVVTNLGGTLTVRVQAGQQIAILVVKIKGTNPSAADVTGFLASKPNSSGFDRILIKESRCFLRPGLWHLPTHEPGPYLRTGVELEVECGSGSEALRRQAN